jgi:hypothetical protein
LANCPFASSRTVAASFSWGISLRIRASCRPRSARSGCCLRVERQPAAMPKVPASRKCKADPPADLRIPGCIGWRQAVFAAERGRSLMFRIAKKYDLYAARVREHPMQEDDHDA